MAGDFYELSGALAEQTVRIDILRTDIEALTSPLFHPDRVTYRSVFQEDLPRFHFDVSILTESQDEALRKLQLINDCVGMLQTANLLVEAQTALALRQDMTAEGVKDCIDGDGRAFTTILERIGLVKTDLDKLNEAYSLDPESYARQLGDLTNQFAEAVRGVPTRFRNMPQQSLLEKIYQARMDYAELATEYSHLKISKLEAELEDAVHLKTALRRGLVPAEQTNFVTNLVAEKTKYVLDMLPDSFAEVMTLKRFLGHVYEMGDDHYGEQDFKVERYESVSVRMLTEFAY